MNEAEYIAELIAIDDRVPLQSLAFEAGPPLIRDAAKRLRAAIDLDPRDVDLVDERVMELAADALRVVRVMAQIADLPSLPSPTVDRLPSLIQDFAPNISGTWIGTDDPLARFADELIRAAERYAASDPKTVSGSTKQRLKYLLRVVGLAAYRPKV